MCGDEHRYDEIIGLPRPVSKKHKPMTMTERAAQFSPFAALTGYDAAVSETARLTDSRKERDEDMISELNERMRILSEWEYKYPEITVEYFVPDERKFGGAYVTVSGNFKWLDEYERMLVMQDGRRIPIDDIFRLEGEIFDGKQGLADADKK